MLMELVAALWVLVTRAAVLKAYAPATEHDGKDRSFKRIAGINDVFLVAVLSD